MQIRLELKPDKTPKPKSKASYPFEKFKHFIKNIRFFFGTRPELELSREELNPNQSLTDIRKKTRLYRDKQMDHEKKPSPADRFVEGVVDFLSAFGMIMAGDLSYDPHAVPEAPSPAPAQPTKADPLAWKKKKRPQPSLPLSANRLSFLKNLTPRPLPVPVKEKDNELNNRYQKPMTLRRY